MITFDRVWRGRVTSLRQAHTTAFGLRLYEVWFKGGKRTFFEIPSKQTLPISIGSQIRFTGHWVGEGGPQPYFFITEVLDSSYMDQLNYAEQERRIKILMEEAYEQQGI